MNKVRPGQSLISAESKMPRVCLGFAAIVLVSLLGARGYSYFEGQSFNKSSFMPLIGLVVLLCFLGYLVTGFMVLMVKFRSRWSLAILAAPLVWFGAYQVPLPDFTDGMRDVLQKKVRPERLRLFAERARVESAKANGHPARDPLVELMKRDFPEIYALSRVEPRVRRRDDGVEITWGGALVKHWGIKIGSRPFAGADADYLKGVSCREAFGGIWVYHDRY